MTLKNMCNLQNVAKEEGVVFFYSGYFTQNVLLSLGEAVKHKMNADDVNLNTSKKIFSVFVEQVQNIIRYSTDRIEEDEHEHEFSYGLIVIGKDSNGKFYICCGNMILKDDIERLRTNLEDIQKMNKDELKKAYKERLKNGPDEYSKGAGIGFLEIARKATEPISFDFQDTGKCNSFFFLQANI